MRLSDVRFDDKHDFVRLTGVMENDAGKPLSEVWFEYGGQWRDFVRADADVFMPVMLIAAMIRGERIQSDLPVSEMLSKRLQRVQAIFRTWFPDKMTTRPPALSNIIRKERTHSGGAGVFFSAGVDSWYVILGESAAEAKEDGRITHLIYIRGVEAPLSKIGEGKEEQVESVAAELGLPIITGRTNVRDVFDYDYLLHLCGPALASCALSLSGGLSRIVIPTGSSYRYEELYPESSHHLLDGLWSTEYLEVEEVGGGATRPEKIARVSREPLALRNLSVCIENKGEYGNCGRCPKCIMTMTALQALGLLEKADAFPSQFDYGAIRRVNLDDPLKRAFVLHNLELARKTGRDPRLTRALERHLRRWEKYRAFVTLVTHTPLHPPARWLRQFVKNCLGGRR